MGRPVYRVNALGGFAAAAVDASMNASPLLVSIAQALAQSRLEAVLIGNAAAALHGAPVTTVDFDFMFRNTPANLTKLKRFASQLEAVIFRPYYPASALFRVINDDRGLQVDFMSAIHGVRSFASLRGRAQMTTVGGYPLLMADLNDIILSKRAANRPRDHAVIAILEKTLHEKEKLKSSQPPGA